MTLEVLEQYLMPPALSQSPCVVREAGVLGVFLPNHPTPSRFNFSVSVTIRSCVNSQRKFPLSLPTLRYRDSGDLQGTVAPPSLPHPAVFYSGLAGFILLPAWQRVVLNSESTIPPQVHGATWAGAWGEGLFLRMGVKTNALQPGEGGVTLKPAAAYH